MCPESVQIRKKKNSKREQKPKINMFFFTPNRRAVTAYAVIKLELAFMFTELP